MNIDFHWPWMIWLLLVPILVRYLWVRTGEDAERNLPGRQQTLLHPGLEALRRSFHARAPRTPIAGRLYQLLLWSLWVLLTLAMMRPQWLESYSETHVQGYDLMLVVDASRSMTAEDFSQMGRSINRMAVLKGVLDRFVANRMGDRVGFILFGTQAYVLSPLTYDLVAVRQQLLDLQPGVAGDGTAIGDGLGLAVKKLRERPPGSRVVLLISDGVNDSGQIPPLAAAQLAQQEGVRVYAIGVGSHEQNVRLLAPDYQSYEIGSNLVPDEALMRQIAEMTGGAYYRATDSQALDQIAEHINTLEKTEAETRSLMIPHALFQWPLGLALLLYLLLGLFPDGRPRVRLARGGQRP